MQRLQVIQQAASVAYVALQAAVIEDYARAGVLVIDVLGLFTLTALKIDIPAQIWVVSGVVVGYFFGRVVNFATSPVTQEIAKTGKGK